MNIRFSFIIPAYNRQNTIERCILSILKVTSINFEIIVVDDGSTDDTPNILKKLQSEDRRIVVRTKRNGGAASARNCGLKCAKGDFIVFVDSDDYVEAEKIDAFLCSIDDLECDIYMMKYAVMNYDGGERFINGTMVKSRECRDGISIMNECIPSNRLAYTLWLYVFNSRFLIRNDILFDEDLRCYEDMLFIPRCLLKAKKVRTIDGGFYHYQVTNDSLITKKDSNSYEHISRAYDKLLILVKSIDSSNLSRFFRSMVNKWYINSCAVKKVKVSYSEVFHKRDILVYELDLKEYFKAFLFLCSRSGYYYVWEKYMKIKKAGIGYI